MAFIQLNCTSHILRKAVSINIIMPQDPRPEFTNGRGIPTLYLLHGKSDDQTAWMRLSAIELYASKYGIAIVMPTTDLGWYTNTKYDARYWDYVSEELPQICENLFPQLSRDRKDRFAAGLSMGGYGAMKLGLGACDRFSMAASLSGALNIISAAERYLQGEEAAYWQNSFGTADELKNTENDLYHLAQKFAAANSPSRLYAWCGTEDFLFTDNEHFVTHLKDLSVPITYEKSTGDHRWDYWDEKIQRVLAWIAKHHDVI